MGKSIAPSRACLLAMLVCLAVTRASAEDSVEQFYKGKEINLIVGSSAGGGYDTYARLIARHIGRYIPGNPTIVPQNMPGAGSNKAGGYVYSLAPKDGTVIGAVFPGTILQPLIGNVPTPHDPSKFIYVGSANSDAYMCVARKDAQVQTFKDLLTHVLIIAGATEGATTHDLPVVENNLLGAHFRIVSGYPGMRENTMAIERNEVQGVCGYGWASLEFPTSRMADARLHQHRGSGKYQGLFQAQRHGRAAHRRLCQDRGGSPDSRIALQPGHLWPALCAAAGRAGGSRCRFAQGLHASPAGQGAA